MRAQGRTEMKPYERARLGPEPKHQDNEAIRMCIRAWVQLDADRKVGMNGTGAIPYTALVTWGEVNRLDRETLELLWLVIHQLDSDRAARIESKRASEKGKKR